MICAVGREMRDYATLVEAIRDWNVPCHIAAKVDAGKTDQWMTDLQDADELPPHITFGTKPYPELRALYARTRFVVLPLYPSNCRRRSRTRRLLAAPRSATTTSTGRPGTGTTSPPASTSAPTSTPPCTG